MMIRNLDTAGIVPRDVRTTSLGRFGSYITDRIVTVVDFRGDVFWNHVGSRFCFGLLLLFRAAGS